MTQPQAHVATEQIRVFRGTEDHFPAESVARQISEMILENIVDRRAAGKNVTLLPKPPGELLEQFATGTNVILMQGNFPIGFAAFYLLAEVGSMKHWELGSVIVAKRMRKQRFGERLYTEVEHLHNAVGGVLYGTTKSERVVEIGLYHGLGRIRFDTLDEEVRRSICYEASCFTPMTRAPQQCRRQIEHGGDCYLRSRISVTCS